jgi:hypothetical protein
MENDFVKLWAALGGDVGLFTQIAVWIGSIRIPLKLVSAFIQKKLTELLVKVADSPFNDDDEMIKVILANKVYRIFAFLFDWVLSVKLPTLQDFEIILADKKVVLKLNTPYAAKTTSDLPK